MKTILALVTLCIASLSVYGEPSGDAHDAPVRHAAAHASEQSLPLRRVILYSNGVGYFERRGTVTGHAEINLSFKESQMDDVLKSMVVLDLGHGQIGAVSYNSSAPLAARLTEIPFSIAPEVEDSSHRELDALRYPSSKCIKLCSHLFFRVGKARDQPLCP